MSSSVQAHLLVHHDLLKSKHPLNHAKHKHKHKKTKKITFTLIITALSFSAVGCNTLRALEPTAILISDIANAL